MTNKQWLLAARPEGMIKESDFTWNESPVPELAGGQILIRVIYLSLDPTNRVWTQDEETYLPPVAIGEVMRGVAVGVVERSRNPAFPVGAYVQGLLGWQLYCVSDGAGLGIVQNNPDIHLTACFDVFGFIGITAYFALLEIGQPKPGETLVVTGAAGAVGSIAGQIGKIKGCRVVGIAGTDEKCRWITEELGFDAAINYRTESVTGALEKHCPGGVDVVFENVGGEIFDAILEHINVRARIVLCGLISQYNATEPVPGPTNFINILMKRARLEGFIVMDYLNRAGEAMADMSKWVAEGRIKRRADITPGLENAPKTVNKLFDGSHKGKLAIQVSSELG